MNIYQYILFITVILFHITRYIEGANSPKNVVILIDRSGSLLGSRMEIASYAARILVETLTTNDFFHVVTVTKKLIFIIFLQNKLDLTRRKVIINYDKIKTD